MNSKGEWYKGGSGRRVKPVTMTPEESRAHQAAGLATLMQHSRAAGVFDRSASRLDTTATAESVPTAGARARQATNGDGGKRGGCV